MQAQIPRRPAFGRAGHRTPLETPCCHRGEWIYQTLQSVLVELAVIKASLQNVPESPKSLPPPTRPARVYEIDGDLFEDAPADASLAHCVGADFLMGAGIAVPIKEKYGNVSYLKSLGRRPGQVASLPISEEQLKFVFYLVTKPRSAYCLPRPDDFVSAVRELAQLCSSLGVPTLAMPRIGAGLDRQPWPWVRSVIEEAFAGVDTDVLIFVHPSERPVNEMKRRSYRDVAASTPVQAAAEKTCPDVSADSFGRNSPKNKQPAHQRSPKVNGMQRLTADIERQQQMRTGHSSRMTDAHQRGGRGRGKDARAARSGTRLVKNKILTDLTKPEFSSLPKPPRTTEPKAVTTGQMKEQTIETGAAPPGPGGAPSEAAKVTAGTGGQAGRTPETCKKAGVPSRASSPTSSPANKGEITLIQSTYPEEEIISSLEANYSGGEGKKEYTSLTKFFADLKGGSEAENLRENFAGGGSLHQLPPLDSDHRPPRQTPNAKVTIGVSDLPKVSPLASFEPSASPQTYSAPTVAPDAPCSTADLAKELSGMRRSIDALAEQVSVGLRGTVPVNIRRSLPRKEAGPSAVRHLSRQPSPSDTSPKIAAPSPSKSTSINYRRHSKNSIVKSRYKVA
ncbi:uncharacterized protein LOC132195083 isoform X1 [Neocloeon triangulifer]|uniref:uncharacterized protein LOC132195083 isoform X1 n=1 Tax=Neocloeon triangulifer TaxID=2078957 RepID=UPI00286F8F49|nr:uncharacterized protein LOC132195083 isoform X1 [Neocloeon triangulifer]